LINFVDATNDVTNVAKPLPIFTNNSNKEQESELLLKEWMVRIN